MTRIIQSGKRLDMFMRLYSSGPGSNWTSSRVRQTFLEYFQSKDHLYVPSSSVVPKKDEGSYFINAGMNQFKPIFLGTVDRNSEMYSYKRAVNSQKCIRVGGKHNDLDDVGNDTYHHTFFEMLGSWSFGDYFKEEACTMAWELLTKEFSLPPNCLYVSYFGGNQELGVPADEECREIWRKLGVSYKRILPFGSADNFWDMGDTGPCGPCTEIHFDPRGRSDAASLVNAGSPEVVELWNLVFMQFDRQHDGSLVRLPRQHVDTGMGLERLCAVMEGTLSNYDTDLFTPLFQHIQQAAGCRSYGGLLGAEDVGGIDKAYRVVGDHARMLTVALSDGVIPGRKDASFKLRHVIHRCVRQACDVLGAPKQTVGTLVPLVVESLGDAFPELRRNVKEVEETVHYTEERYWLTVGVAKKIFQKACTKFNIEPGQILSGSQTSEICEGRFGRDVPLDILCDIADSHNVKVDVHAYEEIINSRQKRAGSPVVSVDEGLSVLSTQELEGLRSSQIAPTDASSVYKYTSDHGVYSFESVDAKVVALKEGKRFVDELSEGQQAAIILDKTCFYAEKGGQVGDQGYLYGSNGCVFRVDDTQQTVDYVLHIGVVETGVLSKNCDITMSLDQDRRETLMRNHTATHILNYCLSKVLGAVKQQGSIVTPQKLTFDFSLNSPSKQVSNKELEKVTALANEIVKSNHAVFTNEVEFTKAKEINSIRYLEDTVYPKDVRVIAIGRPVEHIIQDDSGDAELHQSVELCGGTHVENTGHLQQLSITGFQGGAYGLKSITAVTGTPAIQAMAEGKLLREKVNQLRDWVKNKTNRNLWNSKVTEIQKVLGDTVLPKLDRNYVHQELDKLGRAVQKTTSIKEDLKNNLSNKLSEADAQGLLVCSIGAAKGRDVVSVMASMDIDLPMMVIFPSKDQNNVVQGACYIPESFIQGGVRAEDWASHTCGSLGTPSQPNAKHRGDKDIRMIKVQVKNGQLIDCVKELEAEANLYIMKLDMKKS